MGKRTFLWSTLTGILIALAVQVVHANNAKDLYCAELRAQIIRLEVYVPNAGQEYKLLDRLVKSGPFENGPIGGLINERILQVPHSEKNQRAAYFVLGRYFDSASAEQVTRQRANAIRTLVAQAPVTIQLTAVDHVLGNWGWERKTQSKPERVAGCSVDNFIKSDLSISFLKVGYVGQAATLTFFPAGTSLNQVLAEAKSDPSLAGASIFRDKTRNQYVTYAEFFTTPHLKAAAKPAAEFTTALVLDHQPAIVVQNYEPR